MKTLHGLTLVELLVALALTALLMALAAPSFKRTLQSTTIASSVNTLLADMRYARNQAVRRGGGVVVCRSDAPETASPACGANRLGPQGNGWASGWIVFHDLNNDGARDADEEILRVQAASTGIDSIAGSGQSSRIRFNALGRLSNLNSATSLRFGSDAQFADSVQRVVCVSLSGRARVAGDGTASCAGAD